MSKEQAARIEPAPPSPVAAAPVIPLQSAVIQYAGFAFPVVFVRLPQGFAAQHFHDDAAAWVRVVPLLSKFAEVRAVSYEEDFMIIAVVSGISDRGVVFAKPQILQIQPRQEMLVEDDFHRVGYRHGQYFVARKEDGQQIGPSFPNRQSAIRHLESLYPRRVA